MPVLLQPKSTSMRLFSPALLGGVAVLVVAAFVSFDMIDDSQDTTVIPIPGEVFGPESLAFGGSGGPYTGVSDGRIIRWQANESRWVDFAVTSPERDGCVGGHNHIQMEHICGRPLGLRFNNKTGHLYIADAYMGLLVVGPNGGRASPVATELDGIAFGFTNALDIDQNTGVVYFTDSSTRFPRRNHVSIIITGDSTGRLMKFDPRTNETTLLSDNLKFPNGVALSRDGDFLLFVETTTCRLYKLWLEDQKLVVVDQLPGFPDNIKRNKNGEFWVGINSRRSKLLEWLISNPWIGNFIIMVSPVDITMLHLCFARLFGRFGMGIKLDWDGNMVEVLDVGWKLVSEVEEENGELWIGSVTRSFVAKWTI